MTSSEVPIRLPSDALSKIKIVLNCYQDVPAKISIREFWEEKDKGGLRELLQDIYDKAALFNVDDAKKDAIRTALVNTPVKVGLLGKSGHDIQSVEGEIMNIFLQMRSILIVIYPDYAHENAKLIPSSSVLRTRKSEIVYEFYQVIDQLIDLRDAMIFYVQQRDYASTLFSYLRDVLDKLEERIDLLIQDVLKSVPADNKGIERIHKNCRSKLDDLRICFGCKKNSYNNDQLQDFFYEILRSFRNDIRTLWNDYLRYILQEEGGSVW